MVNFFGSLFHKAIISFVGLVSLIGFISAAPQNVTTTPISQTSQIAVQQANSTSSPEATTSPSTQKTSTALTAGSATTPTGPSEPITTPHQQIVVSPLPPHPSNGCSGTSCNDTSQAPVVTTSPTVSSPSISYINPSIIVQGNSNTLTIVGSGFQNGATLMIGGLAKLNTNSTSPNSMSVSYPGSLPAGTYGVTVTNPDGGSFTVRNALTISAPEAYSQPTETYNTPAPQPTYAQPTVPQLNATYLNFDTAAVNTSAQNLENLEKQYAQDLADIEGGGGIPLQEEEGEQNNLNQAYSSQLSAAQLTLQDAQNQEKIDDAIQVAPSTESQIESEQTQNEQCSSVTLSRGEGEGGIEAEQNSLDCYASAQKEGEDIQAEAIGY